MFGWGQVGVFVFASLFVMQTPVQTGGLSLVFAVVHAWTVYEGMDRTRKP